MSNKYISEQSNQFKNKIIIVTGSTQGSGAETAKLLANRGAKGITICGRNNKNGNKVKSEIESIGAECLYVQADLEKLEDCKKIVSETDKKLLNLVQHRTDGKPTCKSCPTRHYEGYGILDYHHFMGDNKEVYMSSDKIID